MQISTLNSYSVLFEANMLENQKLFDKNDYFINHKGHTNIPKVGQRSLQGIRDFHAGDIFFNLKKNIKLIQRLIMCFLFDV